MAELPDNRLDQEAVAAIKSANKSGELTTSEVIALAWDDESSFDAIERATGLREKDVIKLMRANMKPSSFRMWRERVSGRKAKHEGRMRG